MYWVQVVSVILKNNVFKMKGNLKVGNKPEVTFEIHSHMCVYQISVII